VYSLPFSRQNQTKKKAGGRKETCFALCVASSGIKEAKFGANHHYLSPVIFYHERDSDFASLSLEAFYFYCACFVAASVALFQIPNRKLHVGKAQVLARCVWPCLLLVDTKERNRINVREDE